MSNKKKVIRQYLKEISSGLDCSSSLKSVFIDEIKNEILDSFNDRDDIALDELYEKLGKPEDIAKGFYDRSDYEKLIKKAKRKAIIWRVVAIVLVILLIAIIVCVVEFTNDFGGQINVTNPINTHD